MIKKLKETIEHLTPAFTQDFEKITEEICGRCAGTGLTEEMDSCKFCNGSGRLIRLVKGTLELYPKVDHKKAS